VGYDGQKPTKNPDGGNLGADDIALRRSETPMSPGSGAISQAWEWVKHKPAETLLLSLLMLFFDGGCNFNLPSGGGSDSSSSGSEYGGTVGGGLGDMLTGASGGLGDMLGELGGTLGGLEMGIILGFLAVAITIGLILFVIGTLVSGVSKIYWLRLIRRQNDSLSKTKRAITFLPKLLLTRLLVGLVILLPIMLVGGVMVALAMATGAMAGQDPSLIVGAGFVAGFLVIIPVIVLALGFHFVEYLIVDKNIGYIEAMRASWKLTDGYKFDLFVLLFLAGLLNFVGVLMCCVGVIPANAVGKMGAVSIFYDRITVPGNAYSLDDESLSKVFS
jgi:hypothetical protein